MNQKHHVYYCGTAHEPLGETAPVAAHDPRDAAILWAARGSWPDDMRVVEVRVAGDLSRPVDHCRVTIPIFEIVVIHDAPVVRDRTGGTWIPSSPFRLGAIGSEHWGEVLIRECLEHPDRGAWKQ